MHLIWQLAPECFALCCSENASLACFVTSIIVVAPPHCRVSECPISSGKAPGICVQSRNYAQITAGASWPVRSLERCCHCRTCSLHATTSDQCVTEPERSSSLQAFGGIDVPQAQFGLGHCEKSLWRCHCCWQVVEQIFQHFLL